MKTINYPYIIRTKKYKTVIVTLPYYILFIVLLLFQKKHTMEFVLFRLRVANFS